MEAQSFASRAKTAVTGNGGGGFHLCGFDAVLSALGMTIQLDCNE